MENQSCAKSYYALDRLQSTMFSYAQNGVTALVFLHCELHKSSFLFPMDGSG